MIDGLRRAAELARDYAAKCREVFTGRKGSRGGGKGEPRIWYAWLAAMFEARAAEALAKTYEAMAASEPTPPQGTEVCPNCGNVRPVEWVPPKG